MKRVKGNSRFALTILLSILVFLIFFLSLVLVNVVILIFIATGLYKPELYGYSGITMFIVTTSVASLVVGAIMSAFIVRIPLKPINRLIQGLDMLASGDYSTRLKPLGILKNFPLFVKLTDSFNTLAEELENTEMLRSDFINNFSHEFKTPIVSVAGFAKLIRKGNLTDEQKDEYLSVIEEESLRLSGLATNVLNLTKLESCNILTNVSTYNLSEQLRICILMLEEKWSAKDVEFKLDFREHTVTADQEMLAQVWINLIDNAVKFSTEGSVVEINIKTDEEYIYVSVINSGSFIPEDKRERIFNKFYQSDESHSSEGNGVGLAIVKRAVQLHRGEVTVNCEKNLTMFTVKLPK